MRYYKARQRKDGKWDYTCSMGDYIHPVGYCAAYREWTKEDEDRFAIPADDPQVVKSRSFKDKHHDCGHDSPKEAEECYKQYLLDQKLHKGFSNEVQRKCQVCGEWTQHYIEVDMRFWELCEKHNNRDEVSKLLPAPCETWAS
jgi:hypothetical protein